MERSTKRQNAMIGFTISRLKIDQDTKEELVYTHTDGRTTSIKDLYKHEAIAIIQSLTSGVTTPKSPAAKMRRKILSMAHELGWKLSDGRINMDKVNKWCCTYGYLKKNLDLYLESELPPLVTQFEGAYVHHLKNV